jgi:hypothetical protein
VAHPSEKILRFSGIDSRQLRELLKEATGTDVLEIVRWEEIGTVAERAQ